MHFFILEICVDPITGSIFDGCLSSHARTIASASQLYFSDWMCSSLMTFLYWISDKFPFKALFMPASGLHDWGDILCCRQRSNIPLLNYSMFFKLISIWQTFRDSFKYFSSIKIWETEKLLTPKYLTFPDFLRQSNAFDISSGFSR